jgi:YqaJ-like viral recombinase domain
MKFIACEQGTPEWRQARSGIATASCFADLMAKIKSGESASRKNYRAQLVVERLTGKPVNSFSSAAMRQGTEREPDARRAYMERTGNEVVEVGFCRHDDIECGASPDGLVEVKGVLEIKCPELAKHLEYLRIAAEPPEYRCQIQGEIWLCERDWCDFVSYNPDFPSWAQLIVRRIYRDDKLIKEMQDEISIFMDQVRKETLEIQNLEILG